MRTRIATFITVVQSVLLVGHAIVYETCVHFFAPLAPAELRALRIALPVLWLAFVPASLLAFRFYNPFVRAFYILAAVWIGLLDFLFLASCACWLILAPCLLIGLRVSAPAIAGALFALAALTAVYGIINAAWTRVRRIRVALPGLPPAWRGRTAVLVSDTHLGHVRGLGFSARTAALVARQRPDIVFFVGDMFDGTRVDAPRMAAPWKSLAPPLGVYFVSGNHEEFTHTEEFLAAVSSAGMRVLRNEKVTLDGVQIVGVGFGDSSPAERFAANLKRAAIDPAQPAILLLHAPRDLPVSEKAGISFEVCGHTHSGQIFPFTWFTRRVFGAYTWGLAPFGRMQVYTSCGAGTWGPPLRVGTRPEIVHITFG